MRQFAGNVELDRFQQVFRRVLRALSRYSLRFIRVLRDCCRPEEAVYLHHIPRVIRAGQPW